MKSFFLVALLIGSIACKREEPKDTTSAKGPPVVAGQEMLPYQEPSGAFELLGPARWQVREDDALGPSVGLLGPGNRRFPRSVSIHVSRYPNLVDKSTDPYHYYRGLGLGDGSREVSSFDTKSIGGREVRYYSFESPRRPLHQRNISYYVRHDIAIIPFPGGFYRISHTAPVEIYRDTLPIFEAVVASFKPGPLPPAKKS